MGGDRGPVLLRRGCRWSRVGVARFGLHDSLGGRRHVEPPAEFERGLAERRASVESPEFKLIVLGATAETIEEIPLKSRREPRSSSFLTCFIRLVGISPYPCRLARFATRNLVRDVRKLLVIGRSSLSKGKPTILSGNLIQSGGCDARHFYSRM